MAKVVGKIVHVSGIVKIAIVDAKSNILSFRFAEENANLYEGELIIGTDLNSMVQVKYTALKDTTTYEGFFNILLDASVVGAVDIVDTTTDEEMLKKVLDETAEGQEEQLASYSNFTPEYTPAESNIQPPIDRGEDGAQGLGILQVQTSEGTSSGKQVGADQSPPVITSSNTVDFDENSLNIVHTVNATDTNELVYSLEALLDGDFFTIDASSGEILFKTSPDFDIPLDLGGNNEYNVNVRVTDTLGNFTIQALAIHVQALGANIIGLNDNAPIAQDAIDNALEDAGIITGQLVASDADGSAFEYQLLTNVSEGTLLLQADGSYSFDVGSAFGDLADSQTRDVTFTYKAVETSVVDGNQFESDVKSVTITVTGTNDGVSIDTVNSGIAVAFTEDIGTSTIVAQKYVGETIGANLEDTWTFDFAGGDLFVAMNAIAPNTFDTRVSLYDDQNNLLTSNDDGGAGYNSLIHTNLPAGTYTIKALGSLGEFGNYELLFHQAVTNMSIPVGASEILSSSFEELNASGDIIFNDVDLSDAHTVNVSHLTSNKGALTASVTTSNDVNGEGVVAWEYKVPNEFINYLSNGETVQEVFSVSIQDIDALGNPIGTPIAQPVTVTITGANDTPIVQVSASNIDAAITEDAYQSTFTGDNTSTDSSDLWTFIHTGGDLVISMNADNLAYDAYLLIYPGTGISTPIDEDDDGGLETNSVLTMTNLAAGTYTVEASGQDWGSVGASDFGDYELLFSKPVTMTSMPAVDSVDTTVSANLTASGNLVFVEVDLNDTHDISVVETVSETASNLGTLSITNVDAVDQFGTGVISWNYEVANTATQYLAEGETKLESFSIRIEDRDVNGVLTGTSTDQAITVTLTGKDDVSSITLTQTATDVLSIIDIDGGNINLSSLVDASDTTSLDTIDITGTNEMSVSFLDVFSITDGIHELLINSSDDANDSIHLDNSFDAGVNLGTGYHLYTGTSGLDTVQITIEDTIIVN